MTLLKTLNRIPPRVCRILARRNRGQIPMSYSDIAEASGLARSTVIALAKLESWDNVPAKTIEAYSKACGVDLLRPKTSLIILRKKMGFIRQANAAQRRMYDRLFRAPASTGNGSIQHPVCCEQSGP